MELSNSGRIVIIDDELENEGKPLMDTLSKKQIPFLYFDGKVETLPDDPLTGVRFVFLDIELGIGSGPDSEKNLASTATGVLQSIISPENGPYVIVFWSKHSECIDLILENCKRVNLLPIAHVNLEKTECYDDSHKLDVKIISQHISDKLKNLGAYELFVEWENIVHSSAIEFINEISGDVTSAIEWNEHTYFTLHRLFQTYSEEGYEFSDKEKMESVFQMLNRSYLDSLESKCREAESVIKFFDVNKLEESFYNQYAAKHDTLKNGYEIKEDGSYQIKSDIGSKGRKKIIKVTKEVIDDIIGIDNIAKLNSALFINQSPKIKLTTGNVFKVNDSTIENIICESAGISQSHSHLAAVLLTPRCDIAQKKAMTQRLVYGIRVNAINIDKSKGDHIFIIGPYWYEEKKEHFIINFQTIDMMHKEEVDTLELLFCIKRELLFDIQSKAANHVNRLGNFQIK